MMANSIKALEAKLAKAKIKAASKAQPFKRGPGRPPNPAKRAPAQIAASKIKKKGFKQFKVPAGATITISIAT